MLTVLSAALGMSLSTFRPPAVPLIVHDPYFSIWSCSDKLNDSWPRHWTGTIMALCGLVKVDGQTLRFCGVPGGDMPALDQVKCTVEATTTHYEFTGADIRLHVDFMSPALAKDLDTLSLPVGFIRMSWESVSGAAHKVQAYVDVSGEWCVNRSEQPVIWGRAKLGEREALRIGSQEQPVLKKSGDDLRIDWGQMYVVPPKGASSVISGHTAARSGFRTGALPQADDTRMPRRADDEWPVMASSFELPAGETRSVLLAYDDQYSVEWLRRPIQEYWRRAGETFDSMLTRALSSEGDWFTKASAFDKDLRARAEQIGGAKYADLASLSYRQSLGAHKIVADIDGKPMMFSKENFSNGCMGTVDVLYPASPIMLAENPELLEANLRPLFIYASLPRWKWPFAPHDLGTYPLANGQVYGGGERTEEDQMPVEESGNLIILAAALVDKGGSKEFVRSYLPLLDKWASYLLAKGMDPDNQLCTDDFAGHLAHNSNLSLKAIVALAAYAKLLNEVGGDETRAKTVRSAAEEMAARWPTMANDGGHFRLAFDQPGTWSQKYNLVWDQALGLNLFPAGVREKEMALYKQSISPFGLPLDSRKTYTKLDWCVWTACLADSRSEFETHVDPLWRMANESASRVPLTDWFETKNGLQVGFQARSVVGGVFMPFLLPDGSLKN